MAGRLMPCLLSLPAVLVAGIADAQALADPTRPPAEMAVLAEAGSNEMAGAATAGLQSIIIKKHGRPAALIHGKVVELGGKVGEARLVLVKENAVVLLAADGSRETLSLTPDAEKQSKVGAGGTAKPVGMDAYRGEKRR